MQNLVNKKVDTWIRPWMRESFDGLADEDDRFFSLVIKGAIAFLSRNIVMYGKPINHFIFNTGSSYLYIESNGYSYSTSEVSGEDSIYVTMPRCVVDIDGISVITDELTQPFIRGTYERRVNTDLVGMNAEMRRLPFEINLKCRYVFSTYNEAMVVMEEIFSKLVFSRYYNITYLGNVIKCSIDFPGEQSIEINKIDMTSSETSQKSIELNLKITTSYPSIDERTEMRNDQVISSTSTNMNLHLDIQHTKPSDTEKYNYK